MTSFRNQPFGARFVAMGNEAEGRYTALADHLGWKYARWGLNRPPVSVASLPPFVRFAPDYIESGLFVEVQGGGYDRLIKLKGSKLDALTAWAVHMPVMFFFWNSKHRTWARVSLTDVLAVIDRGDYTMGAFDEGRNPYYSISNSMFAWQPYPDELLTVT